MEKEITIEMITKAIEYLESEPTQKIKTEYFTLEVTPFNIKTITLNRNSKVLIDNFIGHYENKLDNCEIVNILGLKVAKHN